MRRSVAIIGSSVAAVRTAQALRAEGFDGGVMLIGAEPHLPYDKPPLSKQFLSGAWDIERITLLTEEAARDSEIDLRLGVAASDLDTNRQRITLADGATVRYDDLVVASGASARPSPWAATSGVHVIRTLDDSQRLREELGGEGPLIVVGGGFIGAEVAATSHALGRDVTVIDPLLAPIGRAVGYEAGAAVARVHERHGVNTRFGVGVTDVRGAAGNLKVTLSNSETLTASLVVVGIGATPNVEWLGSSSIRTENGVPCDEYGRIGGHAGAFAVGDVAAWFNPLRGKYLRHEHWTSATEQAVCVAHNIVHPDALRTNPAIEFVWSDQYDWKIQIAGSPDLCSDPILIGDPNERSPRFAFLYPAGDGQLGAAVTVNWAKAQVACRRLINTQAAFDEGVSKVRSLEVPGVTS